MEIKKIYEQYEILENNGTGPFEKDVGSVLIKYNNGIPSRAILTIITDKENFRENGPLMKIEKDPSKLLKIANFFNEKVIN